MKKQDLYIAMNEAERFLARARLVAWYQAGGVDYPTDTTLSAAVKRSSMDLTRALAKLRR